MLTLLDVVVHASTEPEPFGRVIAEAMAMRRPVIATRAGGPTEIIEDGRTGFLVPPGDVEALADQITALLTDSALAGRIAEAGYEEARKRFSAEAHSALVQGVYDSVLQPKRTRAPGAERRRAIPARDALHKEVKR
jgi:glycosyltransferase involved in cell wall biosynthesis